MKNKITKHQKSLERRLEEAKSDFQKIMVQVEPFIKKSDIVLTSTEGKWYDATTTLESIVVHNSIYQ